MPHVLTWHPLLTAQAVRTGLDALLRHYEARLESDTAGYLCGTPKACCTLLMICGHALVSVPAASDTPLCRRICAQVSAADVAVYAMLQRLVSTSGDAAFPPCLPGALDATPRLAAWLRRMEAELPVRFKCRERPAGAPRPAGLLCDI